MTDAVGLRPSASSISSVVVFFPAFRTKSEATTIPTSLLLLRTGNLLILLVDIVLAASLSEVSGLTVITVLVMISVILTSGDLLFATILLTISRSVIIPTGNALITTITQPTPLDDMSSAASKTVLFGSIVTTSLVIISLIVGIKYLLKKKTVADKRVVIYSWKLRR